MCGIAGIIDNFTVDEGRLTLTNMLAQIQHRGPDATGTWVNDNIALGMQRLSIIDLPDGDQPIWSNDGVCIIFNGEIYNFKALRKELEAAGYEFQTNSDTEVILHLYRHKGLDAISSLEGMFGICLYDTRINKLYLIRDRLGVKPLYYYHVNNTLIFASEIKSIVAGLDSPPNLNLQAVWDQLTLRYVPAPQTIWQQIVKLEPGCYLEYDLATSKIVITKYWHINFKSAKACKTRDYDAEFADLFLSAVDKRLLAADVPVGILLSGGLDSSAVAAAAVELGHKNFHTFSIGFLDGGNFNELNYARKVAEHIGSTHHEIVIQQTEFMSWIEKLVWHLDEPIADLASIPLYFVSDLAAKHVKVVLSGEGADEVLAGYDLDKLANKLRKLKTLSYLPNSLLNLLPYQSCKNLAKSGYAQFMQQNILHITNSFSEQEKMDLCNFKVERATDLYIKDLYKISTSREPLDQLQQAYCTSWLVEDLLMKADKMSMAASLELRVPFLDHKLVEWAATLPLVHKVGNLRQGYITKRILRNFATKRLPKEIIERQKLGFPVPAYQWLKQDLISYAKDMLSHPQISVLFKSEGLRSIVQAVENGEEKAAHKLWNLIILSAWLQKWQS